MIAVQRERIADILGELKPLLYDHWREISAYQDIPLDPDYDFYCTSAILRCFTVREDGALIGYAILGVSRNKHYRSSLQAVQDIVFVHPQHRGTAGYRLLRFCDRELTKEGVQVCYHHVKKAHPLLGRVLKCMGYEVVEEIWAKRLDKE